MIYDWQRYKGYRFKCTKNGPSSPTQWSYSIATQYGRDKWQPLGCKASSCTLAWAPHLVIMLGIHQEGLITSQNLEKDHYFLIIATRAILYSWSLETSLEHPYYTICFTQIHKNTCKKCFHTSTLKLQLRLHEKYNLLLRAWGGSKRLEEVKELRQIRDKDAVVFPQNVIVFDATHSLKWGKKWIRTGQRKGGLSNSLRLSMWDSKREIERWGNWIEHLSGTEDKRVERNCKERSKGYKEQMNRRGGGE